ncbi:LppA family lipoprotein [Nocardia cyriacigeorgica]|nr:LppA family lipoprotein [Nocardia cyriacigeorgica]
MAFAVMTFMALTACGSRLDDPGAPASADEIAQAEAHMRALPSVHDSEAQLAAVIRQVADAVETAAPALEWQTTANRALGTLGCPSPYLETDGVSMTTDTLRSPTPINDDEWPSVITIARDTAAQHGMTSLTVRADSPGRHDVVLSSPHNGDKITIITHGAAVITGVTGCRFRAEDLQNPASK